MYDRPVRLFFQTQIDNSEPSQVSDDLPPIIDDVDIVQFNKGIECNQKIEDVVHKAAADALERKRKKASANILLAQDRYKRDYDNRQSRGTVLQIGDLVKKWNNRRHDRKGGKLEQRPWLLYS